MKPYLRRIRCLFGVHAYSPWYEKVLRGTKHLALVTEVRHCWDCGHREQRVPAGDPGLKVT